MADPVAKKFQSNGEGPYVMVRVGQSDRTH